MLLELKKAEMTGDFEIVEEPIVQQSNRAQALEQLETAAPQQSSNAKLPEL